MYYLHLVVYGLGRSALLSPWAYNLEVAVLARMCLPVAGGREEYEQTEHCYLVSVRLCPHTYNPAGGMQLRCQESSSITAVIDREAAAEGDQPLELRL